MLISFLYLLVAELLRPPYWSLYSKPRLYLHTIVTSKYFDVAISCVIGVNVITMAIEHYQMPKVYSEIRLFPSLILAI